LHHILLSKNPFTQPINQVFSKTIFSKESTIIAQYPHIQLIQWGQVDSHPFTIMVLTDADAITAVILEWKPDLNRLCTHLFRELQRS
jgi:hypothetical protein